MFRIIFTLFCLLAVPVLAQNRPRITLQTVSQLGTRYPFSNEIAEVISYATPGDWIDKKIFRWDVTNALATNALRIKAAPSVGRYIHDWDGDARLFGAFNSSVSDVGATINIANTNAVALGIPLLLPEGSFKVSTWINLISGSHIRGKGMGKTILLRNSSSAAQTNSLVNATIQTPSVFNPYTTDGGHGADVTASVSDIVIEDFSISEAVGSYSGRAIAIMAAEDATVQRVEVYGITNEWAITLHGNRLKAVDNRIDNTGRIFQDGIHLVGGRDCVISRNFIRSGDDSIAISSAWATDPNIRNILVSDNSLYSTHGHVIRVFQENGSATNQFDGIRFVNNSGLGGLNRNGIVRLSSSSSNVLSESLVIAITSNPVTANSLQINGTTFVWTNGTPASSSMVLIGADSSASATALAAAITNYPVANLTASVTTSNITVTASRPNRVSVQLQIGGWATITKTSVPWYPLKDISISKGAFQMGSFANHSNDVNQGGFGVYAEECQGLKFENITLGPTVFDSFKVVDSDDVEFNNVTSAGATYSGFFNNTVRVENTRRLSITGGDFRNVAGYGSQLIAMANVISAQVSGAFLSNSVLAGGVVGCFSNSVAVAPGMVAMFGNTIHSRSRAMADSFFDPTNFVFTGNEFSGDNLIGFANGTTTPIPGHYIVEENIGFHKGYFRTPRLQTTNSANMSQWFTDASGYATTMGTNGLIKFATDENLTSATAKSVRLTFQSISNNLPALFALWDDSGSFQYTRYGYGSSLNTSPRWHSFGASGTNESAGLEVVRFDLSETANTLPIRVRIGGSNDVFRLNVGAAGTGPGGVGRMIYID